MTLPGRGGGISVGGPNASFSLILVIAFTVTSSTVQDCTHRQ